MSYFGALCIHSKYEMRNEQDPKQVVRSIVSAYKQASGYFEFKMTGEIEPANFRLDFRKVDL